MLSLLGTLLDKIYPFALHSYEANEFKVVTHYLPLHEVVFKYCLSVPVFLFVRFVSHFFLIGFRLPNSSSMREYLSGQLFVKIDQQLESLRNGLVNEKFKSSNISNL